MSAFEGKADINRKVPQCSVSAKSNTKWACGNPTRYDLTSTMIFPTTIATAIIFILTYAGVSLGRIPGFRLDRAGIALTGSALMMAVGAISPEEAYRAINLDILRFFLA